MACREHLSLWTKCAMFCEKLITEMVKCWESVHKSRLQRPFPHRETGYTETRRQGKSWNPADTVGRDWTTKVNNSQGKDLVRETNTFLLSLVLCSTPASSWPHLEKQVGKGTWEMKFPNYKGKWKKGQNLMGPSSHIWGNCESNEGLGLRGKSGGGSCRTCCIKAVPVSRSPETRELPLAFHLGIFSHSTQIHGVNHPRHRQRDSQQICQAHSTQQVPLQAWLKEQREDCGAGTAGEERDSRG